MQYRESLPLRDKEVVLTFDDGPLPPYTNRILDTLASECVKATFFMVGRMVRGYPSIVRRIYNEGHTIANHSQNHPFTFHKMTVEQASMEIEDGFESLRTALGDPKAVAPFFRIPGLLRQTSVEQYLSSRNVMTWSVDFLADDWTHISASEVATARHQPHGSAPQGHPAAARHSAGDRARLSGNPERAQGAGLQDRARRAGDARSAEDGHDAGSVGRALDAGAEGLAAPGLRRHADALSKAEPKLAVPSAAQPRSVLIRSRP